MDGAFINFHKDYLVPKLNFYKTDQFNIISIMFIIVYN